MNETVNKFLLARDKFMPKMHLKQPEFTCNACGPFTKNIERIIKKKKNREKGDLRYIYQNILWKF